MGGVFSRALSKGRNRQAAAHAAKPRFYAISPGRGLAGAGGVATAQSTQSRAVAAPGVVEQRRSGDVDGQGRLGAPLHRTLALGHRAAGLQHLAGQPAQGVALAQQRLDGPAGRAARGLLQDPARRRVGALDPALGIEHDDAGQHGIEHTGEVSGHGRSLPQTA